MSAPPASLLSKRSRGPGLPGPNGSAGPGTRDRAIDLVLAIGLGLGLWYVLCLMVRRLPTPHEVVFGGYEILSDSSAYSQLWATLARILISFVLASLLGFVMGAWMGRSRFANAFFRPWILVGMAAPMPIVIILAVLIFGLGEVSIVAALTFSVFPFVATIMGAAVAGIDHGLLQMSEVFRVTPRERWRHVIVPEVSSAAFAGMRSGFALCWKLVVVIEALVASQGVGTQMEMDFRLLRIDLMIAWAVIFTVVMRLLDRGVLSALEKRSLRWRHGADPARRETTTATQ